MKKKMIIISIILSLMLFIPANVHAVDTTNGNGNWSTSNNTNNSDKNTNTYNGNKSNATEKSNKSGNSKKDTTVDMSEYNQPQNCNTLLGNPKDSNSVAWLIDKILSYATIIGVALVVVLSSVDFLKVIANSDDDQMQKASKRLVIRLILAALLFFVPTITNALLGIFGLTSDSTCGIQQG